MRDNAIKSMYVTINCPAGLSTTEGAPGVSAGGGKKGHRGDRKEWSGPGAAGPAGLNLVLN